MENARQRLVELGMSAPQIEQLSQTRKAASRSDILAPIHGTVVERLAVEGEYVQAGQPVFRVADLSSVWLLLELFPEDAALVRIGQTVNPRLKSLPERTFVGQVEFVEPMVKKRSRTVSIRVVLDNQEGLIRVGDYAQATIEVPVGSSRQVVPRDAVLTAANENIVYVEVETGRFEIRRVITGPTVGQNIVITKGLAEGEKVATSGNFLLDSQMQLAGNPSLIDPSRATEPLEMIAGFSAKELAEIQQLPDQEQQIALEQIICPVTEYKLGSMGVPRKVETQGKTIYICCEACREDVVEDPEFHLSKIASYKASGPKAPAIEDVFEVPEIRDITPIEIDASDSTFEIEVPAFESNAPSHFGAE